MRKLKLISVILLAVLFVNFAASCNIDFSGILNLGGSDSEGTLNLSSGYVIVYNRISKSDMNLKELIEKRYADFNGKIDSNPNKLKTFDKEIILGGVDFKEETKGLVESFNSNTNDMIGAYVVRTIGKKVFVYASCPEAEQLAVDELFKYLEDNKLVIPSDLDRTVYFSLYEYKSSGEVCILPDGVSGIAELASLKIKGAEVSLESGKYDYQISTEPTSAFPTAEEIEATLYSDEMSYEISYSEKSVIVKVSSKDGANSQEYRFSYGFEDEYTVSSVIVNKDGAKGVLSMVSDDGDENTAKIFYNEIAPVYSSFKMSIAMPTRNLANLKTTSDEKAYLMDDNGNYVLEVKTAKIDFWKEILSIGCIELISHTHTHSSCALNDDYAPGYPAGSVLKEIRASAQILRDLLGQNSPFIARAGGTFWPENQAFRNYFYDLVSTDSSFVGMRTTSGDPPLPGASDTKLNTHEKFADAKNRLEIAAILVKGSLASFNEDGTGFAYPNGGKPADVIAAGVGAWTHYIDLAMEHGQWASLGFHQVFEVPSTTTQLSNGYTVPKELFIQLMDYVQPLAESGDLWVATFTEAATYYFEWSTAEVSAKAYSDERVEVTLTDKEEDPRMNMPLTVKVSVPGNWTAAELDSYGTKTPLEIHVDEDGTCFVYANILPGDEVSVIRPAN